MDSILIVGLGGGLGAIARYIIGLLPWKGDFPLLTLLVNLIGAILIGFLTGLATRYRVSPRTLLFWKTGVCGGFTTFSTFSLEAVQLMHSGNRLLAVLYLFASLSGCLLGVWLGETFSHALAE